VKTTTATSTNLDIGYDPITMKILLRRKDTPCHWRIISSIFWPFV